MAILELVLDDYEFNVYDYGTKTQRTFKIYESGSLFAGSGYTATVKITKDGLQRVADISGSFTTLNHTGTFELSADKMFASSGIYQLEVELTKSGEVVSTKQVDIYVFGSAD